MHKQQFRVLYREFLFRMVDLEDHQHGRGAPNVDNRSTGSAVGDYVHP